MGLVRSDACGILRGTASLARRALLWPILACTLGAIAAWSAPAAAQQAAPHAFNLPPAVNLAADAAASERDRVPVFLFFDRYDCPYCDRALARFVVPLSKETPWRERALFRQVEIDQPLPLVDFAGGATTHERLAARYGVTVTPTVIVVDAHGVAIGKPLVGLLTEDFYAAYLEQAIAAGVGKLRGAAP